MNRRNFLRNSLAATVAFPYVARHTVLGANDRVQVGIIGLGGRARWLIQHEDFGEARVVAVADCFSPRLEEAAKLHADGDKWAKYPDYRRMFDKEKLDAVLVETTTHARVLISFHALQAGLDVYAEKPMTLTIEEGRLLTRAVRHYRRVLQTGTQQRSMPINIYASNLVKSGKIGRIEKVVVCNFLPPKRWTPQPEQPVPDGLNWDQWCNQTELRPYHRQLQFNWSSWWDYDGGGESWGVTGWGAHSLDQVHAALGADRTGPLEIWPEEPGQQGRVTMRYAGGTLVKLEEPKKNNHDQLGAIFHGTKGRIQILRGDFIADPPELRAGAPEITKEGPGENSFHFRNFVESIRSRKQPNADVEIGHRSTTACHLVNICRDVGRRLRWDPEAERFLDDPEADRMLSRPRRKGFELPEIG